MRVLQLVDSLDAGGTERMSVNLANGLLSMATYSGLCATRREGDLKSTLDDMVDYLYLEKQSKIDFNAIKTLYTHVKERKIDLIHAHSSSFAFGVIMKMLVPGLRLVWHDHYGNSEFLNDRPSGWLKFAANFFNGSIAVNQELKNWHLSDLRINKVYYLNNFISEINNPPKQKTELNGISGKRIICLANLRPQKDHLNLLEAVNLVFKKFPHWTLHLVGKTFGDPYEDAIRHYIKSHDLKNKVFLYGSVADVNSTLLQADIGVLSSNSEGLPLSLLEYGKARLGVVVTRVGDCAKVIIDNETGLLIAPGDPIQMSKALKRLITDRELTQRLGNKLNYHVNEHFSEKTSLQQLIKFYSTL